MLENKNYFLFDMDGLLIDSERVHLDQWTRIFEKHHIMDKFDVLMRTMGMSGENGRRVFEEKTGDPNFLLPYIKEKQDMMDEYLKDKHLPLKAGAKELLDYLKEIDKEIILVTSTKQSIVKEYLEYAGLSAYFDKMVCGDMVEHSKPDPDIYNLTVETYHLNKEDCVVFEDSPNGIKAGCLAGIDVVAVPDLIDISDLEDEHIILRVESLKDVLVIMGGKQ